MTVSAKVNCDNRIYKTSNCADYNNDEAMCDHAYEHHPEQANYECYFKGGDHQCVANVMCAVFTEVDCSDLSLVTNGCESIGYARASLSEAKKSSARSGPITKKPRTKKPVKRSAVGTMKCSTSYDADGNVCAMSEDFGCITSNATCVV